MSHQYHKGFTSRFHTYRNPFQAIPSGVNTIIQFNTVPYDNINEYNVLTFQFVPIQAGYYCFHARTYFTPVLPIGTLSRMRILLTGLETGRTEFISDGVNWDFHNLTVLLPVTPNDRVEVDAFQNSGINQNVMQGLYMTWLAGFRYA